jgi:DNA invertase Pin-like site-specific DNA recombinase
MQAPGKGGRPKTPPTKWNKVIDLLEENKHTPEEIARLADVGLTTVYKIRENPIRKVEA